MNLGSSILTTVIDGPGTDYTERDVCGFCGDRIELVEDPEPPTLEDALTLTAVRTWWMHAVDNTPICELEP